MHKEAFDWGAISSAAGEGDRSGRQGAADKGRVLALMLQTINDPFLLVDQAARIEEVNEAMAQRVGISRTRLLGANSLAFLTPDKRQQVKQHLHALLRDKSARHFDLPVWGRWYEVSLSPVACETDPAGYIALFARDITERREQEESMRFQAYHDPMTKLPNRRWLDEYLAGLVEAAEHKTLSLTVMFFDLDGMKTVNDSYGHHIGDELLKEVSRRLEQAIRASDLLARFSNEASGDNVVSRIGGDEFVLVLPGLIQKKDAEQVAKRLLSIVKEPFLAAGNSITVSGSIGIVSLSEAGMTAAELLHRADEAMYLAKCCGRDRCCFADELSGA